MAEYIPMAVMLGSTAAMSSAARGNNRTLTAPTPGASSVADYTSLLAGSPAAPSTPTVGAAPAAPQLGQLPQLPTMQSIIDQVSGANQGNETIEGLDVSLNSLLNDEGFVDPQRFITATRGKVDYAAGTQAWFAANPGITGTGPELLARQIADQFGNATIKAKMKPATYSMFGAWTEGPGRELAGRSAVDQAASLQQFSNNWSQPSLLTDAQAQRSSQDLRAVTANRQRTRGRTNNNQFTNNPNSLLGGF